MNDGPNHHSQPSTLNQFGGHKAVVRPDPIPNSAVKHSLADGSSPIGSARVGSRQSFKKAGEKFLRLFVFGLPPATVWLKRKLPDSQPHSFQISRFGVADREIRGLGKVMRLENFPLRRVNGFFSVLEKIFRRPVVGVRRGE